MVVADLEPRHATNSSNLQRIVVVVLCALLLGLSYLSYEQYAARKADDLRHNLQITDQIRSAISTRNNGALIINDIRDLRKYVNSQHGIPAPVARQLVDKLEDIEGKLGDQQSLLSDIEDSLSQYRMGETVPSLDFITPAHAATAAPMTQASTFKLVVVGAAFGMLALLFVLSTIAVFTSKSKATVRFAVDTLKVEIGFLSGLISAFFAGSVSA